MYLNPHVRRRCRERGIPFRAVSQAVRRPFARKRAPGGAMRFYAPLLREGSWAWLVVVLRKSRRGRWRPVTTYFLSSREKSVERRAV